jgi:hypothetical protein
MTDPTSVELRDVWLRRFPLVLWQQTQEHVDELLREFALIAGGQSEHPESVPHRLMELIADLTAAYGGLGAATEQERDEAIARGEVEIDLLYHVPLVVTGAVRQLGDMLDEADDYCRQGTHLLTLQTPPDQLVFRQWFLSEFLTQLAGADPVPWPEYEAAQTG